MAQMNLLHIISVSMELIYQSKKELDFGRGFYMTDDKNVAKKRAQTQTKKYNRIYRKRINQQ